MCCGWKANEIFIMKRERKRKRPHATIYHFYHNIYLYIWWRCVHVVYYTGCLVLDQEIIWLFFVFWFSRYNLLNTSKASLIKHNFKTMYLPYLYIWHSALQILYKFIKIIQLKKKKIILLFVIYYTYRHRNCLYKRIL